MSIHRSAHHGTIRCGLISIAWLWATIGILPAEALAEAQAEAEMEFVWCPSGELGGSIELAGTPLVTSAIIFYDQDVGHYPYFWNGSKIHGGVPQSVDLDAHLEQARLDIRARIPDPNWKGYAILDLESWFAGWEWCPPEYREESRQLVRAMNPSLGEDETERIAIHEYENAAERLLLETLRLCKDERPHATWGFYGYPFAEKASPTVARVLDEVDALYPSAYTPYRGVGRLVVPGPGETYLQWSRASIFNRVHLAREIAGDRPVLPFVWLVYHNMNPVYSGQLLFDVDLEVMLYTPSQAGADGLIFWGHLPDATELSKQESDLHERVVPLLNGRFREGSCCDGEIDGIVPVNFVDLSLVLQGMAQAAGGIATQGDANCDGVVDFGDLTVVLGNWLSACE